MSEIGETAFRKQLYMCLMAQTLWMKGEIESRRSKNYFGTLLKDTIAGIDDRIYFLISNYFLKRLAYMAVERNLAYRRMGTSRIWEQKS